MPVATVPLPTATVNARAISDQGGRAFASGDFRTAYSLFDQLLQADPNNDDALANRGMAAFRLGNADAGLADIRAARADAGRCLEQLWVGLFGCRDPQARQAAVQALALLGVK